MSKDVRGARTVCCAESAWCIVSDDSVRIGTVDTEYVARGVANVIPICAVAAALGLATVGQGMRAHTVKHTALPHACKRVAVGIVDRTKPMHLVALPCAAVTHADRPDVGPAAVPLVVFPFTVIGGAICPRRTAISVHVRMSKVTSVCHVGALYRPY